MIKVEDFFVKVNNHKIPIRYYNSDKSSSSFYKDLANVFIIFTGEGESLNGDRNKYDLAAMFAGHRNYNTFIIGNPGILNDDCELYFDKAIKFVYDKIEEKGNYIAEYDDILGYTHRGYLDITGFSEGAYIVGRFGYKLSDICKITLINPIFNRGYNEFLDGLSELSLNSDTLRSIVILQGSEDSEYKYHVSIQHFVEELADKNRKLEKKEKELEYRQLRNEFRRRKIEEKTNGKISYSADWKDVKENLKPKVKKEHSQKTFYRVLEGADHKFQTWSLDGVLRLICYPFNGGPELETIYRTCPHCGKVSDCGSRGPYCVFCGERMIGEDEILCEHCGEPTKYEKWDSGFCEKCGGDLRLSREGFPWEDIENSMKNFKKDIRTSDKICPHCRKLLLDIHFRSPAWTWQKLCGRDGDLLVCPNCKIDYNFRCHIMN